MTVVASNDSLPDVRNALRYNRNTGQITWAIDRALMCAGDEAGHIMDTGYRTITVDYVAYYAHHLAIWFVTGSLPPGGTHVDHIDGDKDNNRFENLRVVSPSINGHNRTRLNKNNSSGERGVFETRPGRYVAFITVNRRRHHIGVFGSLDQAKDARDRAQKSLVGGAK